MKIVTIFAAALFLVAATSACKGNLADKGQSVNATAADSSIAALTDIKGEWDIENIVFSDTDYVRPAEEVSGSRQYISFTDSTYSIATNCNRIGGEYTLKGDSLMLSDGFMTRMACPNMATEEAMCRIIPLIASVDVENDSTIRLNSKDNSEYVILRRSHR